MAFLLISWTLKDLLVPLQKQLSSHSSHCLPGHQQNFWVSTRSEKLRAIWSRGSQSSKTQPWKQSACSRDSSCGSRATEVPTLEPARKGGQQKEHWMQQRVFGEASSLAEEASYNLLCSHLHVVRRTTTKITPARPQKALWQGSLHDLHQTTSYLTCKKK